MTRLSVFIMEMTKFSASPVPLGDGAEGLVSDAAAKAVSISVSSEMSRIVMNLRNPMISKSSSISSENQKND